MNEFERGKKFAHEALEDILNGPIKESVYYIPLTDGCCAKVTTESETDRAILKALERRVVMVENENSKLKRQLNTLEHRMNVPHERTASEIKRDEARMKESDQVERLKEQNRVLKETICIMATGGIK